MILNIFKTPANADKSQKPNRLLAGLRKTRDILTADIGDLFSGHRPIDEELLEELETRLLMADVGVETTDNVLAALRSTINRKKIDSAEELLAALSNILQQQLKQQSPTTPDYSQRPYCILMVGINGSGKTTTLGKLAQQHRQAGRSVMLAAGDTFRAAAIEQLQHWGERNQVPVVAQQQGADPAAVIYDALQSAQNKNIDVLLADTAGRLHTQSNLMAELQKVQRVMRKLDANAPHETLLVLDATTGQNALQQARQFHAELGVTGLILTKLDGTAKGGIVFAIQQQLGLPVRYLGVGEGIDDLRPFVAAEFVNALLQPA